MLWWTLDLAECRGLAGAIADRAEACFAEASEVTEVWYGGLGGPRRTRSRWKSAERMSTRHSNPCTVSRGW